MTEQLSSPPRRVLVWLAKRGENHRQNLQLLIIGAGLLFVGGAVIIWADRSLQSSIEQEVIALAGTLVCGAGILVALFGYLGLSVLRLVKFFQGKVE